MEETFAMLRSAGLSPRLCDTPVPFSEQSVRAGHPSMPGDPRHDEYILLPKNLVGRYPMFFVDVDGDSMSGAGIMPGDRLRVQVCATAEDGDIVIASVDGECTVKAYFRDEDGRRWLVPRNESYRPIELTVDMDVRILGRVVEHIRQAPRIPHAELLRSIRSSGAAVSSALTGQEASASAIIRKMAPMVRYKRQWYAVYRPMVDGGLVAEGMYASFVDLVCRSVPGHPSLPTAELLRRMAVGCFRRPVARWNAGDAPIAGGRFEEYLRIGVEAQKEVGR